ncbi:SHOCT domain-containing protein [Lentzea sp. BCCO 10_0856]|uniref:SHOCT domain-containing protein n=1 Tax=Lentzea miocenica TaxID=3095431 RepID=A0ABU4TB26_9PSEU|nr:SHOCT domain-containing protein [Lentzea sp. BCCO 10_0856]MDX8035244.1 SHOCT domain-containing protein [Lentzea sp. BCCO 10_0856]
MIAVTPVRFLALSDVDDLPAFTDALRDAVRNATTPAQAPRQDVLAQIAKLADLHAAGILTAEEFQSKKAELLNRL